MAAAQSPSRTRRRLRQPNGSQPEDWYLPVATAREAALVPMTRDRLRYEVCRTLNLRSQRSYCAYAYSKRSRINGLRLPIKRPSNKGQTMKTCDTCEWDGGELSLEQIAYYRESSRWEQGPPARFCRVDHDGLMAVDGLGCGQHKSSAPAETEGKTCGNCWHGLHSPRPGPGHVWCSDRNDSFRDDAPCCRSWKPV